MDIEETTDATPAGGRSKRSCVQASVAAKESNTPAKKRQKRKTTVKSFNGEDLDDVPDNNDWICSLCNHSESHNGTDLVLCDGPCLRSFHVGCLDQMPDQVSPRSLTYNICHRFIN